jgi:hypothetical protein
MALTMMSLVACVPQPLAIALDGVVEGAEALKGAGRPTRPTRARVG